MENAELLFKGKYRIPSARLKNWDYSQDGYYFVTICTKDRECFFGEIINGKMQLSKIGIIAEQYWYEIPNHFKYGRFDNNHGIFPHISPKKHSLSSIVGSFKSIVSKQCHRDGFNDFAWQTRFYDRIIRDQRELNAVRFYIKNNPNKWGTDRNFIINH